MLLLSGAFGVVIAAEGLHNEQVGRARGQIFDLRRVLVEREHGVGSLIKVIILGGRGRNVI